MADNARRTGPAVEAQFQFLQWLVPTIEGFPRSQKFTLGDRIQSTALDVLEALIEARCRRSRPSRCPRPIPRTGQDDDVRAAGSLAPGGCLDVVAPSLHGVAHGLSHDGLVVDPARDVLDLR